MGKKNPGGTPTQTKSYNCPESVEGLFESLALTEVIPGPGQRVKPLREWKNEKSYLLALERLDYFERTMGDRVKWVPLDGKATNDGPTSISSDPRRAFYERVVNGIDAVIELALEKNWNPVEALPKSPKEAVTRYFEIDGVSVDSDALTHGLSDKQIEKFAKTLVVVRAFDKHNATIPNDQICDIRDFGVGLLPDNMPDTILSLNRGNKLNKPYLTGKHGHGASNTFQFSKLTVLVSRHYQSDLVGITVVKQHWDVDENGNRFRTPTYKYLTLDGKIPAFPAPKEFPHGTLVRHFGYSIKHARGQGVDSLFGMMQRMAADPVLPFWTVVHPGEYHQQSGKRQEPHHGYGHLCRGGLKMLDRARYFTLNSRADLERAAEEIEHESGKKTRTQVTYVKEEVFDLGYHDFGGLNDKEHVGSARFRIFVVDPAKSSGKRHDALKNNCDPNRPIIFTLDGQNHAEEQLALLTSAEYAGLYGVGRWMVVQVNCDGLSTRAKYELFTSTREHTKDGPIKKMIVDELVRRLKQNGELQELNKEYSRPPVKTSEDEKEAFSYLLQKYCKDHYGMDFERYTKKVERAVQIDDETKIVRGSNERQPIAPKDPPTFIRWAVKNGKTDPSGQGLPTVTLYPGQKYSWIFETDAPDKFWNGDGTREPGSPGIELSMSGRGVRNRLGDGQLVGGRVKIHFECFEDAVIGTSAFAHADLYYSPTAKPIRATLQILVAAYEHKGKASNGKVRAGSRRGSKTSTEYIDVVHQFLMPIPITPKDSQWHAVLDWPDDTNAVGFAILTLDGVWQVLYNAALPELQELRRSCQSIGMASRFDEILRLELSVFAIRAIKNALPEEAAMSSDLQPKFRRFVATILGQIALTAKSKVEQEHKLKIAGIV